MVFQNKNGIISQTGSSNISFTSYYKTPTWYHNLPINILVLIFGHFDEDELRKDIALVCRRWRYASLQPELWRKFKVYGKDAPTTFICNRIRKLSRLTTIHLNDIKEPTVVLRQICRCAPRVRHLAVTNCSIIPERPLRALIHSCKDLESLNFSGTKFSAKQFYEEIAGLINLKSVNLSKNAFLSVPNLISMVLNCHKLEELLLSQFRPLKYQKQLTDEDAAFIVSNMSSGLKSLTLDATSLTNFSFKAIMQCSKLEKLGLHGAGNLSPEIFTRIWTLLPKLRELKITQAHQITGQNVADLFSTGHNIMERVVVIDFTGCWKITDDGIDAIADCCCQSLRSLALKGCKLITSLQSIHDSCNELEFLNIAFCINLKLSTILPIPDKLSTLVINKNNKFNEIMDDAKQARLTIKMCLSEYNKDIEKYIY